MAGLWALELEEADTRRNWEGLDLGITLRDFPGGSDGKASAYNERDPGSIPKMWRRKWQPTPVLWPGKSHGRRSVVGYSPWGPKETDTTERLHFHFLLAGG